MYCTFKLTVKHKTQVVKNYCNKRIVSKFTSNNFNYQVAATDPNWSY